MFSDFQRGKAMKAGRITTEGEYEMALLRIEVLMDMPECGSVVEELRVLSLAVERYEEKLYPMTLPSLSEAIQFRKEQVGVLKKGS